MFTSSAEVEKLLWCMRPALDLYRLRGPLPDKIRDLEPADRPFRPANHSSYRGFFIATETVNQANALERLIASEAEEVQVNVPSPLSRKHVLESRTAKAAQRRLLQTLDGHADPAVIASLENQFFKVAIALSLYRELNLSEYSGVVVSTQHSPIIRALLIAAGEQSVPTAYVPHAPAADNGAYLDLPVSYVGLRGEGERAFYQSRLGVPEASLDIVGNLASDVLSKPVPDIDRDAPGVLALSPHPSDTIRQIFETVASTDLGQMIVAPHPRSNLDEIREFLPEGWQLRETGRTLDLLASGVAFVFQFASGVGWESAALGIPTATVRIDDSPVNYSFLADESVFPFVRSAEESAEFAARARRGDIDREHLRAHAITWCAVDGESAAFQLQQLLDRVRADGFAERPTRLHDGWGKAGVALQGSWLAGTKASPKR